jgi:thiol:disulfide interchange protein DsbD
MRKILSFIITLFSLASIAQNNPVSWQATYKATSKTEGEIHITATIEKGWHTYSQKTVTDGPIATSFTFTPAKGTSLVGNTEESKPHEEYVKAFEAKISVFTDKAEFKQKIKHTGKPGTVSIKVEYMCCNDMMCLPPKTVDLSVKTQ